MRYTYFIPSRVAHAFNDRLANITNVVDDHNKFHYSWGYEHEMEGIMVRSARVHMSAWVASRYEAELHQLKVNCWYDVAMQDNNINVLFRMLPCRLPECSAVTLVS